MMVFIQIYKLFVTGLRHLRKTIQFSESAKVYWRLHKWLPLKWRFAHKVMTTITAEPFYETTHTTPRNYTYIL